MTQTMLRNRFTAQQMIKAYDIVGEAKKNGLPEGPLMDKLNEGVGKRVQNQNIIMAMEKVKERYQSASQYARQISGDREQAGVLTGHIAECMSAGMTGDSIAKIGRVLGSAETQNNREKSSLEIQAFVTAKTMARVGATSASVSDAVQTALRNGYGQGEMKNLEKAFVNQARAKFSPTSIAESFSRGMNAGVSVETMAQRGYMNSGNTGRGNGYAGGIGAGAVQGGAGGSMGGAGSGAGAGGSGGMGGAGGSSGGSGSSGGRGSGGSGGGGRGGR